MIDGKFLDDIGKEEKRKELLDELNCSGCKRLKGSHCTLETGNHCIRRAEDYYENNR